MKILTESVYFKVFFNDNVLTYRLSEFQIVPYLYQFLLQCKSVVIVFSFILLPLSLLFFLYVIWFGCNVSNHNSTYISILLSFLCSFVCVFGIQCVHWLSQFALDFETNNKCICNTIGWWRDQLAHITPLHQSSNILQKQICISLSFSCSGCSCFCLLSVFLTVNSKKKTKKYCKSYGIYWKIFIASNCRNL